MQARIKNQNGIVIVALSGRVDVETAEPFRAVCLRDFRGQKLVFDFSALSFVGSQGILPFLEIFQVLQEAAPNSFKFCGMGVEFLRVFAATPLNVIGLFETVDGAVASFYLPKVAVAAVPLVSLEAAPLTEGYLPYRSAPIDEPKKSSDSLEADEELEA